MLNRCVVTIRAKEPLHVWLQSLPDCDDITLDEVNRETTAYLLPVYEDDAEKEALLAQYFDLLFEEELGGWWPTGSRLLHSQPLNATPFRRS